MTAPLGRVVGFGVADLLGDGLGDGVVAGLVGLALVAAAAGSSLAPVGAFKLVAVQLTSANVVRAATIVRRIFG